MRLRHLLHVYIFSTPTLVDLRHTKYETENKNEKQPAALAKLFIEHLTAVKIKTHHIPVEYRVFERKLQTPGMYVDTYGDNLYAYIYIIGTNLLLLNVTICTF